MLDFEKAILNLIKKLPEEKTSQVTNQAEKLQNLYREQPAYYHAKTDNSFDLSKKQLLILLDKIIELNPQNLNKLLDFRNRIEEEFISETISSEADRNAILHSLKKELESIFLKYPQKIKELNESDISHLELSLCFQGAYSNMIMLCNTIKTTNFKNSLNHTLSNTIKQLALEYLKKWKINFGVETEIHYVNALCNLAVEKEKLGLQLISDYYAPKHIAEKHVINFIQFLKNNMKLQSFIEQFCDQFEFPNQITYGWVQQQLAFFQRDKPEDFWMFLALNNDTNDRLKRFLFYREIKEISKNTVNILGNVQINDETIIFITPDDMYILKNDIELQPISDEIFNQYKDKIQKNIKDYKLITYNDACYLKELNQETIIKSGFQKKVIMLSLLAKDQTLNNQSMNYLQKIFDGSIFKKTTIFDTNLLELVIDTKHPEFKHFVTPPFNSEVKLFKFIGWLCKNGHARTLELIKNIDPENVKLEIHERQNSASLAHLAAENAHANIIEYLFQMSIDINQKDNFGNTPAHYAIKNGHQNVLETLARLTDISNLDQKNNQGITPLFAAADRKNLEIFDLLFKLFNEKNYIPEINILHQGTGNSFVHIAAKHSNTILLNKLLNQKPSVDLSQTNNDGDTPLIIAAENAHINFIERLYEHDKNLINAQVQEIAYIATKDNNVELLGKILNWQLPVDLTKTDAYNQSLFHIAAKLGYIEILQQLRKLAPNFDLNTKDNVGQTPIFLAASQGHQTVITTLMDNGEINLMEANKLGINPFCIAAYNNHLGVIEALDSINSQASIINTPVFVKRLALYLHYYTKRLDKCYPVF